jgi:hypothetical protein
MLVFLISLFLRIEQCAYLPRFVRTLAGEQASALVQMFGLHLFAGGATSANAQIGSRTTLSYWSLLATPDAWVAIPNIQSMGPLGATKPEVDSTDLDSLAVERIGGLKDGDEFPITAIANQVTQPLFEKFQNDALNIDFRMTFPAPLSRSLYFTWTPLHLDYGTIEPSGLVTVNNNGRLSGDITTVPTH